MATSRQTPRVWSDAIRGSEILANWFKLGANAVVLWLSIGMILDGTIGGVWFLEGTTSLDRRLWLHHFRNGLGIGGPIADLPDPKGSGDRIHVPKPEVQRYTHRSFNSVGRRFQESLFLGFLLAVAGTVTAGYFLRQSGRPATEDQHIRGTTLAPPEVVAMAGAASVPFTNAKSSPRGAIEIMWRKAALVASPRSARRSATASKGPRGPSRQKGSLTRSFSGMIDAARLA